MAEENKPEEGDEVTGDEPTEEKAPAARLTMDEVRQGLAEMSSDEIRSEYETDKARFDEIKGQERRTLNDTEELSYLAEKLGVVAEVFQAMLDAEQIESPSDLPEPVTVGDADGTVNPEGEEEQTPAEAEVEAEPVAASAEDVPAPDGGASTLPMEDAKPAKEPFVMASAGASGADILTLEDFGKALKGSIGRRSETFVGEISPLRGVTAGVLTNNPEENFRLMYGEDTKQMFEIVDRATGKTEADPHRNSFTAAINCGGPPEPVQDIPFCYSQGRPLQDSGIISVFEAVNGQIQLYDCHDLPAVPANFLNDDGPPANLGDCVDCDNSPTLVCGAHTCIQPRPAVEPRPFITCMCIPESLRFSADYLLERALEEFAIHTDIVWEQHWLTQLSALSVARSFDAGASAAHGAHAAFQRMLLDIASNMAGNPRTNCGGLENYSVFVPGGEAMFVAAVKDRISRVVGCDCPGEDILQVISDMTNGNIVFGLDADPTATNNPTFVDYNNEAVGAAPVPLEAGIDAGSLYLIPRDSIGTASPLTVEMGIDDREKAEIERGCLKLIRREWWFDLFTVGCRQPIRIEIDNLNTCGTGPDLTVCV